MITKGVTQPSLSAQVSCRKTEEEEFKDRLKDHSKRLWRVGFQGLEVQGLGP